LVDYLVGEGLSKAEKILAETFIVVVKKMLNGEASLNDE